MGTDKKGMKIKKRYITPHIEEHMIDAEISLFMVSGADGNPETGGISVRSTPSSGPAFENPSAAESPFKDGPDYSNME